MDDFVSSPESKTLEFKRDLSSPKPLLKTPVAFANTAGGKLVIGIDDARRIIGVSNPLDDEERLCNLIADSIAPRLVPNVELLTVDGKTLLMVEVFCSGSRPHWLKSEGLPEPQFLEVGMRLRVVVYLAEALKTVQATEQVEPERLESRLESNLAAKVVILLGKAESGKATLAKLLGHKSVSGELHKQIKRLLALDLIEMTLPDKPNSRLQRYRLTAKGRGYLALTQPTAEKSEK